MTIRLTFYRMADEGRELAGTVTFDGATLTADPPHYARLILEQPRGVTLDPSDAPAILKAMKDAPGRFQSGGRLWVEEIEET